MEDLVIAEVTWVDESQSDSVCSKDGPEKCPSHCTCDSYCGRDADYNC